MFLWNTKFIQLTYLENYSKGTVGLDMQTDFQFTKLLKAKKTRNLL